MESSILWLNQLHIEYHNIQYWNSLKQSLYVFINIYSIQFEIIVLNSKCHVQKYFIQLNLNIPNIQITCKYWAAEMTIKVLSPCNIFLQFTIKALFIGELSKICQIHSILQHYSSTLILVAAHSNSNIAILRCHK